jgi:hypothetical protein
LTDAHLAHITATLAATVANQLRSGISDAVAVFTRPEQLKIADE